MRLSEEALGPQSESKAAALWILEMKKISPQRIERQLDCQLSDAKYGESCSSWGVTSVFAKQCI